MTKTKDFDKAWKDKCPCCGAGKLFYAKLCSGCEKQIITDALNVLPYDEAYMHILRITRKHEQTE